MMRLHHAAGMFTCTAPDIVRGQGNAQLRILLRSCSAQQLHTCMLRSSWSIALGVRPRSSAVKEVKSPSSAHACKSIVNPACLAHQVYDVCAPLSDWLTCYKTASFM